MRTKLTNSASLGKTLARNQIQLSHFAQPKQFDTRSITQSRQQSKKRKKSIGQTPKQSAQKYIPSKLSIQDNLTKIQLNRQKCVHIGQDVHTATVDKNFRLNKMYKDLHHFSICIDQLKWILKEGDKLIHTYLSQILLISPNSSHTLDITNIAQELRSLNLRFKYIEQNKLHGIDQYLKNDKFEQQTNNLIYIDEQKANPQRNHLKAFIQRSLNISSKQKTEDNIHSSVGQTRHFSVPLKENINSSNFPYFDNIKIIKQEQQTPKLKQEKNFNKPLQIQTKSNKENIENTFKLKQEWQSRLKKQNERNEKLVGANQRLKQQIQNLKAKLSTYTVLTTKSIEKLSEILKKLVSNLTPQEREFQLLKMAQSLRNWQKMLEDDLHEAKYNEIYGNPQTLQIQKTKKLQQIIGLQYEINTILAQKAHLQKLGRINQNKLSQNYNLNEDIYRMLFVQSCALQQLCNF